MITFRILKLYTHQWVHLCRCIKLKFTLRFPVVRVHESLFFVILIAVEMFWHSLQQHINRNSMPKKCENGIKICSNKIKLTAKKNPTALRFLKLNALSLFIVELKLITYAAYDVCTVLCVKSTCTYSHIYQNNRPHALDVCGSG